MAKRPRKDTTKDSGESAPETTEPDVEILEPAASEAPDAGNGEPVRRAGPVVWIAGAVIVAGIGFLIWARASTPVPEPRGPDPLALLDQRLAEVDSRLAAFEQELAAFKQGLAAVDQRLAAVAEQSDDTAAALDAELGSDRLDEVMVGIARIVSRLDETEARLDALAARPVATGNGAPPFDPAALEDRLAALELGVAAAPISADESAFETIEARRSSGRGRGRGPPSERPGR